VIMSRWFLFGVSLLYLSLAAYCILNPLAASELVGFSLVGGAGQSEFLTIYGGLELWLALIFALPLFRVAWLPFSLIACISLHGCLVLFRTASFLLFDGIDMGTVRLAAGEWLILLLSVFILLSNKMTFTP
jgi:hypothetical protein